MGAVPKELIAQAYSNVKAAEKLKNEDQDYLVNLTQNILCLYIQSILPLNNPPPWVPT